MALYVWMGRRQGGETQATSGASTTLACNTLFFLNLTLKTADVCNPDPPPSDPPAAAAAASVSAAASAAAGAGAGAAAAGRFRGALLGFDTPPPPPPAAAQQQRQKQQQEDGAAAAAVRAGSAAVGGSQAAGAAASAAAAPAVRPPPLAYPQPGRAPRYDPCIDSKVEVYLNLPEVSDYIDRSTDI